MIRALLTIALLAGAATAQTFQNVTDVSSTGNVGLYLSLIHI